MRIYQQRPCREAHPETHPVKAWDAALDAETGSNCSPAERADRHDCLLRYLDCAPNLKE